MIINRNGEIVESITLKRGEWCRFITKNNVEYIVTNAKGILILTKPLSIKTLKFTNEVKRANIKTV